MGGWGGVQSTGAPVCEHSIANRRAQRANRVVYSQVVSVCAWVDGAVRAELLRWCNIYNITRAQTIYLYMYLYLYPSTYLARADVPVRTRTRRFDIEGIVLPRDGSIGLIVNGVLVCVWVWVWVGGWVIYLCIYREREKCNRYWKIY